MSLGLPAAYPDSVFLCSSLFLVPSHSPWCVPCSALSMSVFLFSVSFTGSFSLNVSSVCLSVCLPPSLSRPLPRPRPTSSSLRSQTGAAPKFPHHVTLSLCTSGQTLLPTTLTSPRGARPRLSAQEHAPSLQPPSPLRQPRPTPPHAVPAPPRAGPAQGPGLGSPDGRCLVAAVQPVLGRNDVHAPEPPVVAVGRAGVLLHLKRVVLDVVDGRQDDAPPVLPDPREGGLGPAGRCMPVGKGMRAGTPRPIPPGRGAGARPPPGRWPHPGLMAPADGGSKGFTSGSPGVAWAADPPAEVSPFPGQPVAKD